MPIYNFQKKFVQKIKRGEKTHTIRSLRLHPAKPGDKLYLYTGLRTKLAKRILPPVVCVKVENIVIAATRTPLSYTAIERFRIFIDGIALADNEMEALARRDGFRDFQEMMDFWDGRLPFNGDIIHWKYTERSK